MKKKFTQFVAFCSALAFFLIPLTLIISPVEAAGTLSARVSSGTLQYPMEDTETITAYYYGHVDAPADPYIFNIYHSKKPLASNPGNNFADTSFWQFAKTESIVISPADISLGDYPKSSDYNLAITDSFQPGKYWCGVELINTKTKGKLSAINNFLVIMDGNPGELETKEGSVLHVDNPSSFNVLNTVSNVPIKADFSGKLTKDGTNGFACELYISVKGQDDMPDIKDIANTSVWAKKYTNSLSFTPEDKDPEATYSKKCVDNYDWPIKNGDTDDGRHWIYTRVFDANQSIAAIDTLTYIDITGNGSIPSADGDFSITFDKVPGVEPKPNTNQYFYDLKPNPNPTASMNIYFAPVNFNEASYKIWTGISHSAFDDTSDSNTDDPNQKWDTTSEDITTKVRDQQTSFDGFRTKTFSDDSLQGYHEIVAKVYVNDEPIPHYTARAWIFVGRCDPGLCDSFKVNLTTDSGLTANTKIMYNLNDPSPVNINVQFDPNNDGITYLGKVAISHKGYDNWGDSHTDDSSSDWSEYPAHTYPVNGSLETFSVKKSFTEDSEEGYHEANVKIYMQKNGGLELYMKRSVWIFVGHMASDEGGNDTGPPKDKKFGIDISAILNMGISSMNIEQLGIQIIFRWLPLAIGLGALAAIIYSGFMFVTSRGEEKGVEKAKKTLIFVITGMLIGTFALTIVSIIVRYLNTVIK